MISSVCRFCGCTSERACRPLLPSGELGEPCQWIDQEETLCSACLSRLSDEELQQLWIEEFIPYTGTLLPPIQFDVVTAFSVVAALQLALKHPDVEHAARHGGVFVRETAEVLAEALSEIGPITSEALRRGFAGCYEPPLAMQAASAIQPQIIIPGE